MEICYTVALIVLIDKCTGSTSSRTSNRIIAENQIANDQQGLPRSTTWNDIGRVYTIFGLKLGQLQGTSARRAPSLTVVDIASSGLARTISKHISGESILNITKLDWSKCKYHESFSYNID